MKRRFTEEQFIGVLKGAAAGFDSGDFLFLGTVKNGRFNLSKAC